MKLLSRQKEILIFFFENINTYHTSDELGAIVGVSGRTVRTDIKVIRDTITPYAGTIKMKKGHGFKLIIDDYPLFMSFFKQVLETSNYENEYDHLNYEYILLNYFFMQNESLTLNDIKNILFVSTPLANQLIKRIRSRLITYELTLENDSGIYSIKGSELEKRRFILSYFMNDDYYNELSFSGANFLKDLPISFEQLYILVIEASRKKDIHFSDYTLKNIIIHLALSLWRILNGDVLVLDQVPAGIEETVEYQISSKILDQISDRLNLIIPPIEYIYLTLHLMAKAKIASSDLNENTLKTTRKEQVAEILQKMKQELALEFQLDEILLQGILNHIDLLEVRLQMNLELPNPLLQEIKVKANTMLQATRQYFSQLDSLIKYDISDEEWAYITFHILAAIERYKQNQILQVIVICASGFGSARMLQEQLENRFGQRINIMSVISYYQLNDEKLKNVDLIISTMDISNHFMGIPVVNVSVFINEEEFEVIDRIIKNHQTQRYLTDEMIEKEDDQEELKEKTELIKRYFLNQQIISLDECHTSKEVITLLTKELTALNSKETQENFTEQVFAREKIASTGFSTLVACPHPLTPQGKFGEVVVGVSTQPIQWDGTHHEVQIVFLLSPSMLEDPYHNELVTMISSFIQDDYKQNKLLHAPTFSNLQQLLI